MPRPEEIGKKIKELRSKMGYTQQDLADLAGTTVAAIGNYEAGVRVPRDSIKIQIAKALNTTVEKIFFAK